MEKTVDDSARRSDETANPPQQNLHFLEKPVCQARTETAQILGAPKKLGNKKINDSFGLENQIAKPLQRNEHFYLWLGFQAKQAMHQHFVAYGKLVWKSVASNRP